MSAKRFQFKPPSVNNSQNLAISRLPSVSKKENEDLWMDDIDEEMLVQASQMVEASVQSHQERMEIDDETLNKFISEEMNDDWDSAPMSTSHKKFPIQTQTVFHIQKQPSVSQQHIPIVPKKPLMQDVKKLNEELERLKAENKSLAQKHQAKSGEVSFLRGELKKKDSKLESNRTDHEKAMKAKAEEVQKAHEIKNEELEKAKTSTDFLKWELKQATEQLEMLKKRKNCDISFQAPTPKRKKVTQKPPPNIDESLFQDDLMEISVEKKSSTKDSSNQTLNQRHRSNVINKGFLCQDKVSLISLTALSDNNTEVTNLAQLSKFVDEIAEGNLTKAFIFIDHLTHANPNQQEILNGILDKLFTTLTSSSNKELSYGIVNVIGAIIQNEALSELLDGEFMLRHCLKLLDKNFETPTLESTKIIFSLIEWIAIEANLVEKIFCSHDRKPDFVNTLWLYVNNLNFPDFKMQKEEVHKMGEFCTFLIFQTANLWKKCANCRSHLLKILVCITWAVVFHLIELEQKYLLEMGKSCLLALHFVWEMDDKDFVQILSGNTIVQRRYIWSINHLSRLVKSKIIYLEHDFLVDDLIVECM